MYTQCRCEHFVSGGGRGGGGRLDRGGVVVTKMFPDVQKYFRTYNNFSENTVVFLFTFSCPENYLNSPENLLKFYINLSALEIYLKFLMSNYHGVATPPPPPPVSFKQTLSDLFHLPKYCASYSRAFCCCHALAWFKFMNFYYIKYSVL